jgi:hypothetical protein
MGKVFSPEELAGSEVVTAPTAPSAPSGKVFSPADLAGSEVVEEHGPATPPPPEELSRARAAFSTTTQGATLGLGDELRGVGGAIGSALNSVINEGRLPTKAELKDAYTEERDSERKTVKQAQEQFPIQSFATEAAGSMLLPVPGLGAAGGAAKAATGIGQKALAAARALAPAAATGAIAGVGYQDSGEGKIADTGDLAGAAAGGAATGAAVTGAVGLAGKGLKKLVASRGTDEIKQRVGNIIGQSPEGAKATPTDRAFLKKAEDAIMNEMVSGPDGKVVQEIAFHPKAGKALEKLEPVLDRLRNSNEAEYSTFAKAGQSGVDAVNDYVPRLQEAIDKLDAQGGHQRQVDGLEAIRDFVTKKAARVQEKGAPTDLKWFRAVTTDFQSEAASKLGGLEPHIAAREGAKTAAKALEVFDDILSAKAQGNPELEQAAQAIRDNNQRFYGLLTLKKALETRARTEVDKSTGPVTGLVKKLGKVGTIGAGAAGFAAGGPLGAAAAMGAGAAIPKIADSIDRRLTGRAIEQLRAAATGRGPDPTSTIKSLAQQLDLPERVLRAAYIRMLSGGSGE